MAKDSSYKYSAGEIDERLEPILKKMEDHGVLIDPGILADLKEEVTTEMEKIKQEMFKLTDEEFNPDSPQQVSKVLFENLELPTDDIKKTSSGNYSTAAGELKKIQNEHEIVNLILEYRELSKIKGTYIDPLPELADENNRLHTDYEQDTSTGRLSSKNPNLQNIPVRSETGRKIRKAFIAPEEQKLLAADYSQIELRLLAHFSEDPTMVDIFKSGRDIHTETAAEIFEVDNQDVSKNQRRKAKEVNFGIIYGITPHGLSRRTDLGYKEAEKYIDDYFSLYPGVQKYIDETIDKAKKQGYTETIFGRERHYDNINSDNQYAREAAERAAVNAPLQGSAADIIKVAMIELDEKLPDDVYMTMQVHDELIFEVPEGKTKDIAELVKEEMEGVTELKVPLIVDLEVGSTWADLEEFEI